MKLPKNFIKMLENKYVLYFVLFLAVTNLIGYLVLGNINAVIFFILVGFLVGNFSKNMIIILTVPLILTSILMVGKRVTEGMTGENADAVKAKVDAAKADPEGTKATMSAKVDDKKAAMKTAVANKLGAAGIGPAQPVVTGSEAPEETTTTAPESTTTEVSGFQSNGTNKSRNNRIDYAATVEDAYGDLNKILGGDGIKNLTQDTQKLMTQQLQLADAMKNMGPLLEQAKGMLKGLDFKELGGLANLAKSFNIGAPAQAQA
jgi:hypothetical protein